MDGMRELVNKPSDAGGSSAGAASASGWGA